MGEKSTESAVEGREAAMGRRYDMELTYYDWRDPFPDQGEATMAAHDRIPVMTWYGPGKASYDDTTLSEVNSGADDSWILRQARAIRSFGRPIFLRLMIEMNGDWYKGYSGHPHQYVAAWRRVYDIFSRAGVKNVIWVWCPNLTPDNWNQYYPGDAYVDIIGVDGYNAWGEWVSPERMFGPFFARYAGRKPLMIGETATNNEGYGAAAWIIDLRNYLEKVAGPRDGVIGVCWFDSDVNSAYDWRVDQTPASWKAWLGLARDPYFGGHGQGR